MSLYLFMQADAGGSPSLVARGFGSTQAAGASEQIQIQIPNEKVLINVLFRLTNYVKIGL